MASRLSGSADIFAHRGRRPWASINYVTAHDGFPLYDLVSYNQKHNEANLETNRDGMDNNYSWNCGVEGPSEDPQIVELRYRQMRNMLATLFLSQGVPMLFAGDELARTQLGNNNSYCQDTPQNWLDWNGIDARRQELIQFVKRLIDLRHRHIVLHRHRFFQGHPTPGTDIKDVTWLHPNGREMTTEDWHNSSLRAFAILLSGEAGTYHRTEEGVPEPDVTFLALLNADNTAIDYSLPILQKPGRWRILVDTLNPTGEAVVQTLEEGQGLEVVSRSLMLLMRKGEAANVKVT